MSLRLRSTIDLPPGEPGGFDHGDVDEKTGFVFVAHTAFDTVEIIDGPGARHVRTVPDCPEGSGVAAAAEAGSIFAAARGAGRVLVLDAASGTLVRELSAGFRPNGCAWNPERKQLLVADVQDSQARLVDVEAGLVIATTQLAGRPRWAAYDAGRQRFLVNISDPASVAVLDQSGAVLKSWPVTAAGPHGMALDQGTQKVFIACDDAQLVCLDLDEGRELSRLTIAGPPDVLWYNPVKSLLYVAIGNPGVMQAIHTPSMQLVEELETEPGAHTLTFDVTRQLLYVFLPQSCAVAVYDQTDGDQAP